MIELHDITFAYPRQPPLFTQFSWRVEHGQAWAVLGASGCGKTSLLYLLAGLRLPLRGQVRVHGQPLSRPRPQTGLILQDYGLLPWATARQNVALGLEIRGFYGPDGKHAPRSLLPSAPERQRQEVDFWLARLGIADVAEKYPMQLSGGQRQRTAIARTLVLQPDLLLMDEPFASLDAPTRQELQGLLLNLRREQDLTLVIVTHAIEEAAALGENILLLGQPPHRQPQVIANPASATPDYRLSPAYLDLCQRLHHLLASQHQTLHSPPSPSKKG